MNIPGLPAGHKEWQATREKHLQEDLINSAFTNDLYLQYKKKLGTLRYWVLIQVQMQLVPERVTKLLQFNGRRWIKPVLSIYKLLRKISLERFFKNILLPAAYKNQIKALDITSRA